MLFHHISCLPQSAVAYTVLNILKKLNLLGLYLEVKPFLSKHHIIDVADYSKSKWRNLINSKIHSDNRDFLLEWSQTYKKVDSLSLACENYEVNPYFNELNLYESRLKFRERSGCLKDL